MAEKQSIKRFIVRDPHGHIEKEDSFSVVGEVHVDIVPGYGEPYAESVYVNGILTITIHNIEGNGITEITTDSQEGDEAVNTVTIKTNANPEGVTLEVRNGSKGETGPQGPQGPQGASAVFDPETGNILATLENTIGLNDSSAMTQKAVTNELTYEYKRLDVSSYPIQDCYVSGGKWVSGNSNNNTRWIPVTAGQIFKFEDKGYYSNGYCAIFLASGQWTAGQSLSNLTPANWAKSTKIAQVPEGCNYLMISHVQNGYDAEPRVYTPVTIKEKLANDTLLLSEQQLDKSERKQAQSNIGLAVYDKDNSQLVPQNVVISNGGNAMLRTYLPDNYLDLEVYEGKSYRDIFETEALYHQDFEGTSPTLVGGATIVTSQHDAGTKSMHCNANNAYLKVVNVMRNNKVVPMYVAFRANVPTYSAGSVCNFWTGTKSTIKCDRATNGWESFTGIEDVGKFGSYTYLDIYFGTFSSWTSDNDAYIDNISFVPLTIFSEQPTKEQLDAWYEDYIAIKQGVYTPSVDHVDIPFVSKHISQLSEPNYGFTNDECIEEFMAAMNAKAEEIGMSSSSFSNPYGGNRWGYNWITTEDAIKMVIHSCAYPSVINHLSQKTPAKFRIVNSKTPSRTGDYYYPLLDSQSFTPIMTRLQSAYNYLHPNAEMPYQVLSIKGAGWGDLPNDNPDSKVTGYVGTALIQGKQVAFACYAAKTAYDVTPPSGQTLRALGTIQLLDICNTALSGGDISGMAVTYCNCAMAAEIPNATPNAFKGNYGITPIYSLNATEVINPASSTKVLAAMVMMDVDTNIYDCVEVITYDESYDSTQHEWSPNDSGDFAQHDGDRQNVDALLWGSLGYSNGVSTITLARLYGGKMLYAKSKVGL